MVGLIVIAPLLAFAVWIICTVAKEVFARHSGKKKTTPFFVFALIGICIGIWLAFSLSYKPNANFQLSGFPVPTTIGKLENKQWNFNNPPGLIRLLGFTTDFLFGIAIALLPLKIISAVRKLKQELHR